MNENTTFRTPKVMTTELDISSATLRRWSDEFAEFLSAEAGSSKRKGHRRYSDTDLQTLGMVKALMNDGMTYEQVRQQLLDKFEPWSDRVSRIPADDDLDDDDFDFDEPHDLGPTTLIAMNGGDSAAAEFISNTLITLSENQKSVLNSQAANRELLGVLIQDNFNLKEENTQLRERILDVERNLAQLRQEDEWRRESLRQELDAKISQATHLAAEAITAAHTPQPPPDIKAVKSKSGCLGALFGGGDIQIVSVPRRKGRQGTEAVPPPPVYGPLAPPQQQQPPAAHPKPMAPPE